MQHQNLNPAAGAPPRSTVPSPPANAAALDPRVEDYLDHVCAPLVGKVPFERRRELRWEIGCHLQALAEAFEELGDSREEAVVKALGQFGDPGTIGKEWRGQWQAHRPAPGPLPLSACVPAYFQALQYFVPALAVMWGYFAIHSNLPTLSTLAVQFFALLLPLTLGARVGWRTSGRPSLGTALAILSLVLVLRAIMSVAPQEDIDRSPLVLALVVPALCWLPLAAIAAAVAVRFRTWLETPRFPWAVR